MIAAGRKHLRAEIGRIEGLVTVLMTPRNGILWTPEDQVFLNNELRRLARATPAFLIFLLPGGALMLPVYAWFLDTRKTSRLGVA